MAAKLISEETRERVRQVWFNVLDDLADGKRVDKTLAKFGISPEVKRIFVTTEPNARAEWDEAREISADAFFDEALDTMRSAEAKANPNYARVKIDTLKWASRIRNPRLYGDRQQLDVNVKQYDMHAIIEAANTRLLASRTIQGEHVRLPDTIDALL